MPDDLDGTYAENSQTLKDGILEKTMDEDPAKQHAQFLNGTVIWSLKRSKVHIESNPRMETLLLEAPNETVVTTVIKSRGSKSVSAFEQHAQQIENRDSGQAFGKITNQFI